MIMLRCGVCPKVARRAHHHGTVRCRLCGWLYSLCDAIGHLRQCHPDAYGALAVPVRVKEGAC